MSANETAIKNNDTKILTNCDDIQANKHELTNLKQSLSNLTLENEKLSLLVDDQIDRGMRETLLFDGVKGRDKTWSETKELLAETLRKLEEKKIQDERDRYGYEGFAAEIVRAHRGTKGKKDENRIYAKFVSAERTAKKQ